MVDESAVRQSLDQKPHLRLMLFPFGFLITSRANELDFEAFPFYGAWVREECGEYQVVLHPDQKLYQLQRGDVWHFLVGHAYDPFLMLSDEKEILRELADGLDAGPAGHAEALNRLTGVFALGYVQGETVKVFGDAAGMQTVYYGHVEGRPYVVSHAALVGVLEGLVLSDYVRRLVSYRFYHLFGSALPGDLSPYSALRRLVPNHTLSVNGGGCDVRRFFPAAGTGVADPEVEYRTLVDCATQVLSNSMALVASKWSRPALSLTGGCDSQTTLACAVGHYDDLRYFSYISSPEERVDAEAAQGICAGLGLDHELIQVPVEEIRAQPDFDDISRILDLSYGNIGRMSASEVAKRMVLRSSDIEVEIKSWASEIGRCYYHKRFSKSAFPKRPKPRYLTTLYKVFMNDRGLVRSTDQIFEDYLGRYMGNDVLKSSSWVDLFFWEFRVGAWNGAVITGEHRFSFEIEVPYNNRMLLATLLSTPVAARVADAPHRDMRDLANPRVNELEVSVVNVKHTKARSYAERAYLELHSRIPV